MKRTFRSLLLLGLLLGLVLAGCGARTAGTSPASARPAQATMAPRPTAVPAAVPRGEAGTAPNLDAAAAERKIILTANLQLVVQETEKTVEAIKGLVAAQEGYVSTANVWREGSLLRAHLTVRVPADRMEPFLAEVKKLAVRVEREESGGRDVTEEFVDIEAQLKNLEAAEKELRELLATVREKTEKAEDIMAVYRELTNVRGQIDRLKGRQQYLSRMVEMATVNLELTERALEPIGQPGWQPLQTLRQALNALVQAAKLAIELTIWVVAFLIPLLIVPVGVLWLLWRWTRRRRRAGS